jgi:hypothetical protein
MALRFKLSAYTPQFGKGTALNQSTLTTLYKAVMQLMENGKRVVGKLSDLVMIPHELSGGRSGEGQHVGWFLKKLMLDCGGT